MEPDKAQLDALCAAIEEYYNPQAADDDEDSFYYDDDTDDPTFTFRVGGVLVDFGSVLNYDGLYRLREGGAYSGGRTYTGSTVEELARKILVGKHDDE